jgi:pimeloyl-ACP methyl ester carboxylesterase
LLDAIVEIACLLVLGGVLLYLSSGRPKTFKDPDGRPLAGSVSEKFRIPVNGVEQGMFIRGKDSTKPVLLFLHGGPGMPEYFLEQTHPSALEDDFVVCWWEQRGTGMSYGAAPESLTVEQLVSDTIAVADYLRRRFDKDRVYLMGHSWGSFLGIQVAQRAPDRFHAYVGMGQMSFQAESEVRAYEYALRAYQDRGDSGMVKRLGRTPVTVDQPLPRPYLRIRDKAMHRLGVGTTRDMRSVVTGVFLAVWTTRAYTIREKVNIGRGKLLSRSRLWDEMQRTDLRAKVRNIPIPAYFWGGKYDYTVSYDLAKDYLSQLGAPLKGFYTFEHSAHSPLFEEPERARRILREDVLAGLNRLADGATTGPAAASSAPRPA